MWLRMPLELESSTKGEMMITRRVWLGTSALALLWSAQAEAQAPQAAVPQSTEEANAQQQPLPADIVITARRRSENLMRTPTSGSVLTGENLAHKGVATVDALQFATPSIVVNNFGQGIDFNVRGIGK